jgi:hypothetical protein
MNSCLDTEHSHFLLPSGFVVTEKYSTALIQLLILIIN